MDQIKIHKCEYCGKTATHRLSAGKGYVRYSCKDCWQRVKETAIADGVETFEAMILKFFEVKDE